MDNKTKEVILNRLFKKCGYFAGGMQHLPEILKVDDVLEAINIDEHFFKEIKNPNGE